MAASRFHLSLQLLLIALHFATVTRTYGFDMVFVRTDSANQTASGASNVGVDDLCIPDPMSYEYDFDATGTQNDQDSDYATVGGGVAATTDDCSAVTTFLSSARNFTAQTAATYAPNVTAAAQAEVSFLESCDCDFDYYNSSWSTGSAQGTYEAQQEGLVTAQGTIIAWEIGEVGLDGASISAPNMSVAIQSVPGGYIAWASVYDEANDDYIQFDDEWWDAGVNETFMSSKYVSQYAELSLSAYAEARSEATGIYPINRKGISAMAAMYGEY